MNNNDEHENILAMAGSKKNPLILKLGEYEGTRTLDIRNFFFDKEGNLKPTRKGISLSEKKYNIVNNILKENEEKIKDWFREKCKTHEKVQKHQERLLKAREDAKFHSQKYSVIGKKWKSPIFFEHKAIGGEDEVIINENHPFYLAIEKNFESYNKDIKEEIKKVFYLLLISFSRAKTLFHDSTKASPDEIFEIFEFNWGNFLKHYLQE